MVPTSRHIIVPLVSQCYCTYMSAQEAPDNAPSSLLAGRQASYVRSSVLEQRVLSPEAHDVVTVCVDSDHKVAYLPSLPELVLALLSAHGAPEPLGVLLI